MQLALSPVTDFESYETPEALTRYLFRWMRQTGTPIEGRVMEPCVGSGAIVRAAPDVQWLTNDFDPRWCETPRDAAKSSTWNDWPDVDWAVTNPPFSVALEIAEAALAHTYVGVALHLRASIHEVLKTGPRRSWMREHPPSGILWLPRVAYQRSRSTGKWTTDSVTCCWVIWLRAGGAQFLDYADERCLVELDAETPAFRARADRLCGYTDSEIDRQRQHVERWKGVAA